jgi:sugar phosphate isomerase/epimerase
MSVNPLSRRSFIAQSASLLSIGASRAGSLRPTVMDDITHRTPGVSLKLALNAYSFDDQLRAGTTTLEKLVDFCAEQRLGALDATGYYFPSYPKVPSDEEIFALKRNAYLNGVTISFTGVKNDFTLPNAADRKKEIQLVKDWTVVASKLGAPMIRVFTGPDQVKGYTFEQVVEWMIPAFQECAEFGESQGVMIGLQNHEDFVRTADEVIGIVERVNSSWFGAILDVGSLRKFDVYEEIEKLLPYAVSWLIKENIWYGEKAVPVDLHKVKAIIDRHGYRGYLPILTLGEGDPKQKVIMLANQMRSVFGSELT